MLGKIFDVIGFSTLHDEIIKQLTIYRIVFPKSKLKTTEFLRRYAQIYWNEDKIIANYAHLWKIEKVFRISKHDLKIRPIYHRLHRKIEDHITINFVAYKIYKELERQLKIKKTDISPEKAIEIAENIY